MRTVKRYSRPLNHGKWEELERLARQYRSEKNSHLRYYAADTHYINDKSHLDQQMRNVRASYRSPTGLQARQWKIVQKEAYQTVDKYWAALAADIRGMVGGQARIWTEAEKHYAYWLCSTPKRLASLHAGLAPVPDHFQVCYTERKRVRNYLRRVIRRKRGNRPVARLARSIVLDADMYTLVEKMGSYGKKVQFLKVMGLKPRKQVIIPLTGYATIRGNIRLVLDHKQHRVEVHAAIELVGKEVDEEGAALALDAGISEVFTDENGTVYEPSFGQTLNEASRQLLRTGKARSKLHALAKTSSKHKAHRIRKYNLGRKKLKDRKRKGQIRVRQHISQAIHQVARARKPSILITERLDIRGKAKSKGMSRIVSYWMRSALKERLEFLALVEGFHHQQVNPAYTSQICPNCLFVHQGNRRGDIFQCLYCGHTDHADRVAAINLKARYNDPEIKVFTPKAVVRSILQKRFIADSQRQGEPSTLASSSVPGRTAAQRKVRQSETPPPSKPPSPMGAVQECHV